MVHAHLPSVRVWVGLALLVLCLGACKSPDHTATAQRGSEPIGSERGAVVALDPNTVSGPLFYLTSQPEGERLEAMRAAAPGVEFVAGLTRASAPQHGARAHGVDAHLVTAELLGAAPQLAWVQSYSAGVETVLAVPGLVEREGLVLTNGSGAHGPVIAEHVFALLLHLTRGLSTYGEAQGRGEWARGGFDGKALAGRTLLVAGLGAIGDQVARRAKAFEMTVLATARTQRERPAHVDELVTSDRMDELLPRADVLVICLPLTAETRGLFDRKRLSLLPKGAYVINIARGAILDSDALLEALVSGHLGGAGLDVTDPEPLPTGYALWSAPNLVITPHVAGDAELTRQRRDALIDENLARFATGRPLLNVVDRAAGY